MLGARLGQMEPVEQDGITVFGHDVARLGSSVPYQPATRSASVDEGAALQGEDVGVAIALDPALGGEAAEHVGLRPVVRVGGEAGQGLDLDRAGAFEHNITRRHHQLPENAH